MKENARRPGAAAEPMTMVPVAYIRSDFKEKFGIPRQSGLVETRAEVVFVPPYNQIEAVRGLEEFSHIWLLWGFSENIRADKGWSATVRPPRLGGNVRKGVFATRSPFRPNPIGLSCVRLERVDLRTQGPVLHVLGADLMDGTPIFDVKPYLPYSDSRPEAVGGFAAGRQDYRLDVAIEPALADRVPAEQREILKKILAQDPRPSYQDDPARIYGMTYGDMEIRFRVEAGLLTVVDISISQASRDRK